MELKKCPKCGGDILESSKFCSHCGYEMPPEISIVDPETFLGPDEYKQMTEYTQTRTENDETDHSNYTSSREAGNTDANKGVRKKQTIQKKPYSNNKNSVQSYEDNQTTRHKTKVKHKVKHKTKHRTKRDWGFFSSKKRARRPRRRKERSRGGLFGFLFKLILLVAVAAALFWGYRKYGDRIISYAKDFYNNRIKTEGTAEPGQDTNAGENSGHDTDTGNKEDAPNDTGTVTENKTDTGDGVGTAEKGTDAGSTGEDTDNNTQE